MTRSFFAASAACLRGHGAGTGTVPSRDLRRRTARTCRTPRPSKPWGDPRQASASRFPIQRIAAGPQPVPRRPLRGDSQGNPPGLAGAASSSTPCWTGRRPRDLVRGGRDRPGRGAFSQRHLHGEFERRRTGTDPSSSTPPHCRRSIMERLGGAGTTPCRTGNGGQPLLGSNDRPSERRRRGNRGRRTRRDGRSAGGVHAGGGGSRRRQPACPGWSSFPVGRRPRRQSSRR